MSDVGEVPCPEGVGVARHVRRFPAQPGHVGTWPGWLPPSVVEALLDRGITAPWVHQCEVAEAAHAGWHTVVATGTASGKSLAYLLPVLAATCGSADASAPAGADGLRESVVRSARPHTALYLAPTKALAHDQLRWCTELGLPDWRVAVVDGDSDREERDWARQHAAFLLTNPDLVHHAILPRHDRWAGFLRSLRYIVIDECHRYRGVFGAHVASVIRRLRRICASLGTEPVVICASATTVAPELVASRLIGADEADVVAVTEDSSPHPRRDVVLWQPAGHHDQVAAAWLAEEVLAGRQTITFVGSRVMAEVVALRAREIAGDDARIEAYRGGYLAADRRRLEHDLQSGQLAGVAATNALELGVDISGMDSVVLSGYPGTRAAFWQQVGRAGRSGRSATAVLIARDNPLDAHLLDHPEALLDEPVEATVIHPENPFVLGPHLAAAASELPLTPDDEQWFGPHMVPLAERLADQGVLRQRSGPRWYWTRPHLPHAAIDLRAIGGRAVDVVDETTGRVLGQVDPDAVDRSLHPGAVYLHAGETWLVSSLDSDDATALVRPAQVHYWTQPRSESQMTIVTTDDERRLGRATLCRGEVELSSQVVGYLRRDERTGKVWDSTPLESPVRTLTTRAVWWTVDPDLAERSGLSSKQFAGAAHAAEHTAIGLLPLFAPCDRWDIGGVSTALHPQTGEITIFVYDGHPGGAGFADHAFAVAEPWWMATLARLTQCPCDDGCPACVVSPKCGNANQVLDKESARLLMSIVLGT